MPERYRSIIDVHVILEREQEILLLERQGTGYCDGMLHLPSGHLDEGETLADGAAREASEEVGVHIDPADLRLAAVVHHRQRPDLARVECSSPPAVGPANRTTPNHTNAASSCGVTRQLFPPTRSSTPPPGSPRT
ncbi:MAG TPA: NUDIX domain-containing protein [Actinoallomurus sp.]